jgi:hypothetical protein
MAPSSMMERERRLIAHRFAVRSTAVHSGFDTVKLMTLASASAPHRTETMDSIVPRTRPTTMTDRVTSATLTAGGPSASC